MTQKRTSSERHLLEKIFEQSLSMMVFIRGPEFVFEIANTKFMEFVGRQDIQGKAVRDVLPDAYAQELIDILEQVWTTREPFTGNELPILVERTKYGPALGYFNFVYQPLTDATGAVIGIVGQGQDVTEQVRSRLAIEVERENFRRLFRETPEMVCILRGPKHVFEFVNESHISALGFDATGMTVQEAQPESIEVFEILDDVYKTGRVAHLLEIPITVTDRLRYFNITYSPRRDESGQIDGIMVLGVEITEEVLNRGKLQESENRLKFALANANMGTWTVKFPSGEVILSDESQQLFGFLRQTSDIEQTIESVIHPEDQSRAHRELTEAIANHQLYESEYRIVRPIDGEIRWIFATGRAAYDENGAPKILSGIIMDISDQKNAEILLVAARDEAERANRLKSAFLANMSHEIRTPLGAMLGFADLMKDPGLTEAERANYIDILIRNGESLSVVINDILDLSKVEAGHLSLEYTEISPEQIGEDVVSLLRVKAKEKDLALDFIMDQSMPTSLVSDPTRVRQILLNLVGNAIKFTQFGSIKVKCFGCDTDQGRAAVCFEVSDTGIGIPQSQRERVFEVFVQADDTMTRRFGGTGLGLALSRRLARALGGDVSIMRSEQDAGSSFLLTVEDHPELRSDSSVAPVGQNRSRDDTPGRSLTGTRVLVVDDAPDNQQLIWRYLTRQGAIVEAAENGFLGYRSALNGEFDVVLMDIQMPIMDGYTATQKLRERGYTKPIIALTAHAMAEVRKKCFSVGCTEQLTKPINARDLISTISNVVSKTV